MKIEPGKEYQTRDGRKARIYATDSGHERYPIHGAVFNECWNLDSWTVSGRCDSIVTHHNDLVSEWVEKPVVDWSAMPAWAKFVTMDKDGDWYWFVEPPSNDYGYAWLRDADISLIDNRCGRIPPAYTPTFAGDWKDSLVSRP